MTADRSDHIPCGISTGDIGAERRQVIGGGIVQFDDDSIRVFDLPIARIKQVKGFPQSYSYIRRGNDLFAVQLFANICQQGKTRLRLGLRNFDCQGAADTGA